MKQLVEKFKSTTTLLKHKITSKQQRRRQLLANPEVRELMMAAFLEGQRLGDLDELFKILAR